TNCFHLPSNKLRNVYNKRGHNATRKQRMHDRGYFYGVQCRLFVVMTHSRKACTFANDAAGACVIRMRVVPMRREDHLRFIPPNDAHHCSARLLGEPYVTVGQFKIKPKIEL